MAKMKAAVKMPKPPVTPKVSLTQGTTTVKPTKPYTTEGIAIYRLTAGFKIARIQAGANLAMNKAPTTPKGPPMAIANTVTARLPMIKLKAPNWLLSGFHTEEKKNSPTETSLKVSSPCWLIKNSRATIISVKIQAARTKTPRTHLSALSLA